MVRWTGQTMRSSWDNVSCTWEVTTPKQMPQWASLTIDLSVSDFITVVCSIWKLDRASCHLHPEGSIPAAFSSVWVILIISQISVNLLGTPRNHSVSIQNLEHREEDHEFNRRARVRARNGGFHQYWVPENEASRQSHLKVLDLTSGRHWLISTRTKRSDRASRENEAYRACRSRSVGWWKLVTEGGAP